MARQSKQTQKLNFNLFEANTTQSEQVQESTPLMGCSTPLEQEKIKDACPRCGGRSLKSVRPWEAGGTHYCAAGCLSADKTDAFYFSPRAETFDEAAEKEIAKQIVATEVEGTDSAIASPEPITEPELPSVVYEEVKIPDHDILMLGCSATDIPLGNGTVQCIVTSPPYWGLRKYAGEQEVIWGGEKKCEHVWGEEQKKTYEDSKVRWNHTGSGTLTPKGETSQGCWCQVCGAWRGAYGLEPTVELYIAHSVQILRELRRVLRGDGVVFWNLWDSYAGGSIGRNDVDRKYSSSGTARESLGGAALKPKDLCLIPHRLALAAQADGWWIRSLIIWHKPNPMPESCTDRPTDSYEHIIMMTKSAEYFWDKDAVTESSRNEWKATDLVNKKQCASDDPLLRIYGHGTYHSDEVRNVRNVRNVWTFPTQPYSGAHFATFPEELPRRCILAATSERGACAKCGAPYERKVKVSGGTIGMGDWMNRELVDESGGMKRFTAEQVKAASDGSYKRETLGWEKSCQCLGDEVKPCIVLDPFGGSGTTGRVALELNRRAVLCDITYEDSTGYKGLAEARTKGVQRKLPIYS